MGLRHLTRCLVQFQLLLPVFGGRLAEPAVDAIGCTVLEMPRRKVGLNIGHAPTRDVVLVVELADVVVSRNVMVLLVVLVLMLVVLVVLKGFPQVHLLHKVLVPSSPVHHNVLALVPMGVVEHAELLRRRLAPGRSRWRGGVGVGERYAGARCGRPHSAGEVAYILCVLWIEGIAGSPGVDRVLGHLRESRR